MSVTIAVTLMTACTMFAWWGFNLWLPGYLSLSAKSGGIGLSVQVMSAMVFVMQIGMWFGYVTFGFISDSIGRKPSYVIYLVSAAILIMAYTATPNAWVLLALGPVVAFFATGYFSGFGATSPARSPGSPNARPRTARPSSRARIASTSDPFRRARERAAPEQGFFSPIRSVGHEDDGFRARAAVRPARA